MTQVQQVNKLLGAKYNEIEMGKNRLESIRETESICISESKGKLLILVTEYRLLVNIETYATDSVNPAVLYSFSFLPFRSHVCFVLTVQHLSVMLAEI